MTNKVRFDVTWAIRLAFTNSPRILLAPVRVMRTNPKWSLLP